MVRAVRSGQSWRAVARQFGVSVGLVGFGLRRARGRRLDCVDWSDRSSGPPLPPNRTKRRVERHVLRLRRWLRLHDPLGYFGADAIRRRLLAEGAPAPGARTIARILRRAGVTPQKRRRHPPPPAGWYLPAVAAGHAELDQLDVVEGLQLRQRGPVEVLTGISLWGKLAVAEPAHTGWRVESICAVLAAHWQRWGAPEYLQMDNDTRFAGSGRAVRRLGRLIRFCLAHGVVPVFAPPRETGFQAAVESFNALWQAKVWQRFRHRDLRQLRGRNRAFLGAHHHHHGRDQMPRRTGRSSPAASVVFLRRTDARGRIRVLGAEVVVASHWPHRLVRAELNVRTHTLRVHALRRRAPAHQPVLKILLFRLRDAVTF